MKKPIHRILALLPMLALAISAMMYFFYGIAQFQYKIAASKNISARKDLHTIKISLKDFNNRGGNDEIWFAGKLYDISSYTIQDDSACVMIFHDEQEEGLVKSIADSFEPYDKYVSDNTVHIVKHRIHAPDDNKVLTTPVSLNNAFEPYAYHNTLPYFITYSSPVYNSVLKPPPDIA